MSHPTPSPAPSATDSGPFAGLTAPAPAGIAATGGDKYGLGSWGGANVNPGDLPVLGSLISGGQNTTGDQIVEAFAKANPSQLASMQYTLYMGGFYSSSKYQPTYGVISSDDITAFGHAVKLAGQSGQSVAGLLLQSAKVGTEAGITAAAAQLPKKTTVIRVPAKQDLESAAMTAFQNVLGRKATPQEAAHFASLYQSMAVGVERGNAAAQAQGTAGTISATQGESFDQQLAQIGQTPHYTPTQLFDTNVDPEQPPGFGEQANDLLSLKDSIVQAAAAKTPVVGGTITEQQPESVDAAAENFARSTHPKGAARTDLGSSLDMFLNIIGSKLGA